ncbi:NAD(P)H-dependent oxidoreductase [Streptomyces alkaliphilus]|nr:NAD(P)H-dependent oxidoreductase [Streptomyces alkaliphilus]
MLPAGHHRWFPRRGPARPVPSDRRAPFRGRDHAHRHGRARDDHSRGEVTRCPLPGCARSHGTGRNVTHHPYIRERESRAMARRESVAVAGGGIGGLATAIALAGRGMEVTVIERAERLDTRERGLVLSPDGVRAVDALGGGLGDRLRELGRVAPPGGVRLVMDPGGTVLAEEPIDPPGGPRGGPRILLLRSALQRALLDEALAAGAAVLLSSGVEDYVTHDDGVTVRLSGDRSVECAALVAADGIDSAIRRRVVGDGAPVYRGYASMSGLTGGSVPGPRLYTFEGRDIRLCVTPVRGDTVYWTATIASPPGVWPAKGPDRARRDLVEALIGWYPPVVELIGNSDPHGIVVTDVHDRDPAPCWVDGRVALLGDAAHPMVPVLGEGPGTALEDALALADALGSHDSVPSALVAYERERMERTTALVLAARGRGAPGRPVGALSGSRGQEPRGQGEVTGAGHGRSGGIDDVLGWKPFPSRSRRLLPPVPGEVSRRTPGRSAPGKKPHIVLVSGSLREGSTCDRVVNWCARRCAEQDATVRVFEGAGIDFPAYRPGLSETRHEVGEFLNELRSADGVVLVSPAYHGTVSGLLKNALDYISDLREPVPHLDGRAIGCVAVGAASGDAEATLATLRAIGRAVRGRPASVGVVIPRAPGSEEEQTVPREERLLRMLSQILWMARARPTPGSPGFLDTAA